MDAISITHMYKKNIALCFLLCALIKKVITFPKSIWQTIEDGRQILANHDSPST